MCTFEHVRRSSPSTGSENQLRSKRLIGFKSKLPKRHRCTASTQDLTPEFNMKIVFALSFDSLFSTGFFTIRLVFYLYIQRHVLFVERSQLFLLNHTTVFIRTTHLILNSKSNTTYIYCPFKVVSLLYFVRIVYCVHNTYSIFGRRFHSSFF